MCFPSTRAFFRAVHVIMRARRTELELPTAVFISVQLKSCERCDRGNGVLWRTRTGTERASAFPPKKRCFDGRARHGRAQLKEEGRPRYCVREWRGSRRASVRLAPRWANLTRLRSQ